MKMIFGSISARASLMALAMLLAFGVAGVRGSRAAQEAKSSGGAAGNAENGKKIFMKDGCYQCHGRE